MNRILLTEYKNRLLYGLWEQDRPVELALYEMTAELSLGDIIIARVRDIVPTIHAAFVQLSPTQNAYLPLEQAPSGLRSGDEIAVQITKESQKTKDPVVSANWSLAGKLAVLVTDHTRIGVSGKISDTAWKKDIIEQVQTWIHEAAQTSPDQDTNGEQGSRPYGFILRTGAYQASAEELKQEILQLLAQYQSLQTIASTRSCYSQLLTTDPAWLSRIFGLQGTYEILTDSSRILEQCRHFLEEHQLTDRFPLRYYQDPSYPLSKLYSLDTVLENALNKHVWLKSGGYLVIEPTEAMVVIDVNTGKSDSRRSKEEHILRLNLEAADEIAHQLRLRNLSGMILIDFIDMRKEEQEEQLLQQLRKAVKNDPVGVTVVDITKLGIVECTRRKKARPLHEQVKL